VRHVISTNPRCYVFNCKMTAKRLKPRVPGSSSIWYRCPRHGGRFQPITEAEYDRDMRDAAAAAERLRQQCVK
jgi:hypothetical protein